MVEFRSIAESTEALLWKMLWKQDYAAAQAGLTAGGHRTSDATETGRDQGM